ncbi:type III-B CRISPR module-associated protein Cmr5 [Deinococcus marmoris]|uniref:type III-B CRISPR module-associated protein Cmr5 n=1 Tax=Deinococcus marmoris TaxID=249408 RepID=UPI000495B358|nr:type III-B CRISPR module-associated protein Cmr5 [Deinococcus marmoris]
MTYIKRSHTLAVQAEQDWVAAGPQHQEAYARLARQLPYMLRTAGLAPTVIFLQTKTKDKETARLLLRNLAAALGHGTQGQGDTKALYQTALQVDHPAAYLQLIQGALDYAVWVKRVSAGRDA